MPPSNKGCDDLINLYEVNFLPLFYVENVIIPVYRYVESLHNFNIKMAFLWGENFHGIQYLGVRRSDTVEICVNCYETSLIFVKVNQSPQIPDFMTKLRKFWTRPSMQLTITSQDSSEFWIWHKIAHFLHFCRVNLCHIFTDISFVKSIRKKYAFSLLCKIHIFLSLVIKWKKGKNQRLRVLACTY